MPPTSPPPPDAAREPTPFSCELPPVRRPWLVLAGLALPFATVAVGWWIADAAAAGRRDDLWWDAAGTWVFWAVIVALMIAAACFLPVAGQMRHPSQVILAVILGVLYFVALFLFNVFAYFRTSGPFP